MALDAATAQELIKQLAEERNAYLQSVNKTHELLIQAINQAAGTATPVGNRLPLDFVRRANNTTSIDVESVQRGPQGSIMTGESSSDFDDHESLFAQTPLAPETFTLEGFRKHLKEYEWTEADESILGEVHRDSAILSSDVMFPTALGELPDRSHLSHYSIFDVGSDGAPLPIKSASDHNKEARPMAIWNRLKNTNADPNRERKAVGRITIVREPSPLLFAALHYTMNKHFDVSELFQFLVDDDPALCHPHRAFSPDHRHQRSFCFTMEYFTVIGDGCVPMAWQRADESGQASETHIPISRCSSVIALSLEGKPMTTVRNKDRRQQRGFGEVFDPFSPWRVLSITAYPDWRSSIDAHDSTKHYVNGPEAFLVTLRAEYKDACKRLMEVHRRITDLVEPPKDFIFRLETRDKLLFEDHEFTMSRRYFWAYNTLGIMNEDIEELISAYNENFKADVWDGTNKIIWPGGDETSSSRQAHWRKRMAILREDLEAEVKKLEQIEKLNEKRMKIIRGLHGNLFSGTSVHESRRSVEQASITVEQGRNIKLLTLVTIFFLPLTFVTSVFGMTNMPQRGPFYHFAWATVAICVPTYLLIGSLNTTSGLRFWDRHTRKLFSALGHGLAMFLNLFGYRPRWADSYFKNSVQHDPRFLRDSNFKRSSSTDNAMIQRDTFDGMPVLSNRETLPAPTHRKQRSAGSGPPIRAGTFASIDQVSGTRNNSPGHDKWRPKRPTSLSSQTRPLPPSAPATQPNPPASPGAPGTPLVDRAGSPVPLPVQIEEQTATAEKLANDQGSSDETASQKSRTDTERSSLFSRLFSSNKRSTVSRKKKNKLEEV